MCQVNAISRGKCDDITLYRPSLPAARIRPKWVLLSAGFDSHRLDPVGSLGLEVEDFSWLTTSVIDVATSYAQGPVVSTLEGGYNRPILAKCVAAHLTALAIKQDNLPHDS